MIKIDKEILEVIISTLISIEKKIPSFHFGIIGVEGMDTFSYESTTEIALKHFIMKLEEPVHELFKADLNGSTVRVKVGRVVAGCYSPARREIKEAIVLVYAFYVEMKDRYGRIDDEVTDMLLLQLNSWQKKYFPDNQLALMLAQKIFKPEIFA